MSSLCVSFALLLLLTCFTVYQIFYIHDLEHDLISPYDLADHINGIIIKEFVLPGVLSALFLLTSHWFLFLMSMSVLFVISSNLIFLYSSFALLVLLLCSAIYRIFCIDDLEHDLISPYHLAECIKGLITKEFVRHGVLCVFFLLTSHWFMLLMSAPFTYYHLKLYTEGAVFSVLQNGKQYGMFELGVYVIVFLTIAFANSYSGEETDSSLESTGASGDPLYRLIYFTEFDWHIQTVVLDLNQYIWLGDTESIRGIIAPLVGGNNVTIQYLTEDDAPLPTLRPLFELLEFQGQYRIIEFYAYPSYMVWPGDRRKYVAVDRSDLDGTVRWVDIRGTGGLAGLRNEVILVTGELPPASRLLWASAKGELEELDFLITQGDMWDICLYPLMKIFVRL